MVENANPILGLAGSMATTYMNNRMAQENASISYNRQKELMEIQNKMNMNNAMNMPGVQAFGLRQAGFNPAMVQGAGTQAAPTVSQGNADMAQTIPFNAQDALMMAQMENIKANTKKTEAEAEIVPTEGERLAAQTVLYGKQAELTEEQKEQVKQEALRIKNINEQYADQNKGLTMYGRVLAEKWQDTEWYNHLSQDTRDTIDSLAAGDVNLTVGLMDALERQIEAQGRISDIDHKMIRNAFDNAIVESQFNDKEVMYALRREPWYKKENLRLTNAKIAEDTKRIKEEIQKLLAEKPYWATNAENESAILGYEADMKKMLNKSFEAGDLDYLKSQGEYGKWIEKYSEGLLERIIPMLSGGAAAGRVSSSMNNKQPVPNKQTKQPDKKSSQGTYDWNGSGFEDRNIRRETPLPGADIGQRPDGVSQFDWNRIQKGANRKSSTRIK